MMTDAEVAQLWRSHYVHRKYDPWSRVICELIRVIVNDRTGGGKSDGRLQENLSRARAELRISKQEWDDF
jgi:hypothetical protein